MDRGLYQWHSGNMKEGGEVETHGKPNTIERKSKSLTKEEIEDEIEIDAEVSQDEVIEEYFAPAEIEEEEIVEAEIFKVVEVMPEFPGGAAKMMEYIQKNMKYPMMARESDIQGRVFVNFVVEPDGSITNVTVMRGIGGGCDEEALRVVWHALNNVVALYVVHSQCLSSSNYNSKKLKHHTKELLKTALFFVHKNS